MNKGFRSFADRLTRRIILLWILMMAVLSTVVLLRMEAGISRQSEAHYGDVLDLTDEKVQGILRSVEVSAVNVREGVERDLSSPSAVYASLERELKLNPHLRGSAIAFVSNYFPSEGHWFEPYVERRKDGSFRRAQIASEAQDYFKAPQFNEAIATGKDFWAEPEVLESGYKMLLCTYSLPIHDKEGRTIGVLGVNASLDWLTEQMREIDLIVNERSEVPGNREKHPYSFLLDRTGDYLSHPDTNMIERNYFDQYDPVASKGDTSYLHVGHEMLAGGKGYAKTVVNGVRSFVYYAPIDRTMWSVGIVVPTSTLLKPGISQGLFLLAMMFLGMLAVALVCWYTVKRMARPLRFLAQSAHEVAKGDFETPLPEIKDDDEIRLLRDSFADMEKSLSVYVRELTATTAQKASMESELAIARDIQMSMLPKDFPSLPDQVDVYASLTPARAVGGDFYDFRIRGGRLYFCIGDVSGKGVPAALVMSMISTQFRSLSSTEGTPERIVAAINASAEGHNDSMMFATLFVGILDLSTGHLSYCNAGHNAPVLAGRKPHFLKVEANLPVGVEKGWDYKGQRLTLFPGSTLLLYTDGLTEAEDESQNQFGEPRLIDTLQGTDAESPEATVHALAAAVRQFVGKAEQSDDLTMLAIRFLGTV